SDRSWRFVRVNELDDGDIRFYLSDRLDGRKAPESTRLDWYAAIPEEARHLLASPRLLFLMSEKLHAAVEANPGDSLAAVGALNLRTMADVYWLAYFDRGHYVSPESQVPGKGEEERRRNLKGLIAQGLNIRLNLKGIGFKYLGLDINDVPDDSNQEERI